MVLAHQSLFAFKISVIGFSYIWLCFTDQIFFSFFELFKENVMEYLKELKGYKGPCLHPTYSPEPPPGRWACVWTSDCLCFLIASSRFLILKQTSGGVWHRSKRQVSQVLPFSGVNRSSVRRRRASAKGIWGLCKEPHEGQKGQEFRTPSSGPRLELVPLPGVHLLCGIHQDSPGLPGTPFLSPPASLCLCHYPPTSCWRPWGPITSLFPTVLGTV